MIQEEHLTEADLARLARLHLAAIPDSLPALLGPRYLEALYRFFAASSLESLIIRREDLLVIGACVVSLQEETLYRRLLKATLPELLRALPLRLLNGRMLRALADILPRSLPSGNHRSQEPRIVYIFADTALQGRGVGAHLLAEAERFLGRYPYPAYSARTVNHPDNRAIEFYRRNGFRSAGTEVEGGREFLVLRKQHSDSIS